MILVNYFSLYIKEKDFKNLRRKKKTTFRETGVF